MFLLYSKYSSAVSFLLWCSFSYVVLFFHCTSSPFFCGAPSSVLPALLWCLFFCCASSPFICCAPSSVVLLLYYPLFCCASSSVVLLLLYCPFFNSVNSSTLCALLLCFICCKVCSVPSFFLDIPSPALSYSRTTYILVVFLSFGKLLRPYVSVMGQCELHKRQVFRVLLQFSHLSVACIQRLRHTVQYSKAFFLIYKKEMRRLFLNRSFLLANCCLHHSVVTPY